MLVLKEGIINMPIMSLQTGAEIARTVQPIIDPRELTIVAFYCQGSGIGFQPAVLHVDDIREVSPIGFIVDSADVIMSPNDLVRLQQVIGFHFSLEGKQVVQEDKQKIGKVANYAVDTRSFYITQLHVQPGLLQSWSTANVIINRIQIIQIDDTRIVVSAPTIQDKAAQPATITQLPLTPAQPEASHSVTKDHQAPA